MKTNIVGYQKIKKRILNNKYIKSWGLLFYFGSNVTCPCCQKNFSKFKPYGDRLGAVCPNCNSFERHRLLWLYIHNKTNLFSQDFKLLYVAPKLIFDRLFKSKKNLDYLSVDLNSPLAMKQMDITDISYEDNSFDVIFCNHVLEHIIDDSKAMKELLRILKPGGWAILQVPLDKQREITFEDISITSPEKRKHFFGQEDHVRVYGKDYKQRLINAGFNVKIQSYPQELGMESIKQYGLIADEDIYFCTK